MKPFISICIPAYKQVTYLERLLNSVAAQSFSDYEVVVTDDSPDDGVKKLCEEYQSRLPLYYFKNEVPLGSPENWNEGIRRARGEWIKIMHDDDWFSNEGSLQEFANAATTNTGSTFIFSGYTDVDLQHNKKYPFIISSAYLRLLHKTPLTLFKKNFIGHPSTTLIKNNGDYVYDKTLKWVVDIEFYIRYLNQHSFFPILKPLINIGINEFQITKEAFRNPEVEVPETLYLYYKLPAGSFKNVFVFDYYWRFIRNLSIRTVDDIMKYAPQQNLPGIISDMIEAQAKWPQGLLKNGFVSKSLMFVSYLKNSSKQ